MKFSIIFANTGDEIQYDTLNSLAADMLSYYVHNLNSSGVNEFSMMTVSRAPLLDSVTNLQQSIVNSNNFIAELLGRKFAELSDRECLDQRVLNSYHEDWVRSQTLMYDIKLNHSRLQTPQSQRIFDMFPDEIAKSNVGNIVSKLGVKEIYDSINLNIHRIEGLFSTIRYKVTSNEWVSFESSGSERLLTNDICNFQLSFNHLGRTLYDKFCNRDCNLEFKDENNFRELLGFVTLKFSKPEHIPLSPEYINWCSTHNREPTGSFLNIGNIPDLESRLTDYRYMIYRNEAEGNTFSININ